MVPSFQSPEDLAIEQIKNHTAYIPGDQPTDFNKFTKLNTNENPYPASPLVERAVATQIANLRRYPNPQSEELRAAIGKLHGIDSSQVIIGNGSDELLTLCVRCFSNSDNPVGITTPSYSLYENLASLQGSPLIEVPFSDDFTLDCEAIGKCEANLFFLTSPNAPSGVGFCNETLSKAIKGFGGLMVIDEAYADFAEENAISLLEEFDRLIITRTLSKSYGLAGLRVGYALGSPKVIATMDKAREVYNVDRLAQAAALAAIQDQDYFERRRQQVVETRDQIASWLAVKGWQTYPSQANFVFTEPKTKEGLTGSEVSKSVFSYLFDHKVLTRYFSNHPLTSSRLRISIGTDNEMALVIKLLQAWLKKEKAK